MKVALRCAWERQAVRERIPTLCVLPQEPFRSKMWASCSASALAQVCHMTGNFGWYKWKRLGSYAFMFKCVLAIHNQLTAISCILLRMRQFIELDL